MPLCTQTGTDLPRGTPSQRETLLAFDQDRQRRTNVRKVPRTRAGCRQTGVYSPCPRDFLLVSIEKLTGKGNFAGTPAGCPFCDFFLMCIVCSLVDPRAASPIVNVVALQKATLLVKILGGGPYRASSAGPTPLAPPPLTPFFSGPDLDLIWTRQVCLGEGRGKSGRTGWDGPAGPPGSLDLGGFMMGN